MDVWEALKASKDDCGLRVAVTYPGRAAVAIDFDDGKPPLMISITDENSHGESLPGGAYIALNGGKDVKFYENYNWRPAVFEGVEVLDLTTLGEACDAASEQL